MKSLFLVALTVLILITAITLTSCGKEAVREAGINNKTTTYVLSAKVPPGNCRITGRIISIKPNLLTSNPKNVCSQYPCFATVKIDSILGYGAAFSKPVNRGKEITLKFEYSLKPTTKELFPNMDERLPGLDVNSVFTGDIEYLSPAENPEIIDDNTYRIFYYKTK